MFRTIRLGAHAQAQGKYIRNLADGRIEIDLGDRLLSGPPVSELAALPEGKLAPIFATSR